MATPIDCRAYYVTEKSSQASCTNLNNNNNNNNNNNYGDAGSGFSVSKYLIDRSGSGNERNSSAGLFRDHGNIVCVVENFTDGAQNGTANAVATGDDVRTSGRARPRSVRGRLQRVVCRLETLLRDMKVV